MDIYCPKCEWEPPAGAEWTCKCGHSWHTFDTHGQCPECGKVWRETQCHQCHEWSPHHDWYHDLPPVDVEEMTETEEAPTDGSALIQRNTASASTNVRRKARASSSHSSVTSASNRSAT